MKSQAKSELRRRMRKARRSLSVEEQLIASRMTCRLVARSPAFLAARNLAIYHPVRGELDVRPLQHLAWRSGKRVFLPIICEGPRRRMEFAEIEATTPLIPNRFGIVEPIAQIRTIAPRLLDLVLTPLVAFDTRGHRVGMGAGYYDRCFRFLSRAKAWRKPKLLGIAYSFQEVGVLVPDPWDVPLWGVATELALHHPLSRRRPGKPRT